MIGERRIVTGSLGTILLTGLALFPGCLAGQGISLPLGTEAPGAALEDLDGNPVQILDFVEAGKLTLIEFWASWCENCEALQPQLDQIHAEFGSQVNLVAVAVAVSQSQRRVKRHVEEHGIEYPYLWDGEGEAVKAYEVPGTSIVVILDGTGKVAYTGTGRDQKLVDAVKELIEG
jgi:thiol-disulfide isomerase/thioredoxin